MRRLLSRRLAIVILVVCTALPAAASPRRDDPGPGFFERIVKILKHLVPSLSEDLSWPKP